MLKKRNYQFWSIVLIFFGLMIILIFGYLLFVQGQINVHGNLDLIKLAALGNFIGGIVGSLWALAGIFLIFQALKEQRQDTETNISLLKTQIEKLEISKKTAAEQEKILKIQQFESTFYSLFKFFTDTYDNIEFNFPLDSSSFEKIKGKKVFSKIAEQLNSKAESSKHFGIWSDVWILQEYEVIYERMEEVLIPYFGILYRLLKLIDNNDFDVNEKYSYSKTIRSYLTNSELLLLHYHWQRHFGWHFKDLLQKYNLLKHLSIDFRPEFLKHKKKLAEINGSETVRPVDLWVISTHLSSCLFKAIYQKEQYCSYRLNYSYVYTRVKKKLNNIEVSIEIPSDDHLNDLWNTGDIAEIMDGYYPYKEVIPKLRDYDFCSLIEEIVYAKIIVDNFFEFDEGRDVKSIYTVKREVIEDPGRDKIFKCTFTFKDEKKIWVLYDFDDLNKMLENIKHDENATD